MTSYFLAPLHLFVPVSCVAETEPSIQGSNNSVRGQEPDEEGVLYVPAPHVGELVRQRLLCVNPKIMFLEIY